MSIPNYREVAPDEDYAEGNPYRAQIAAMDDTFTEGVVRVEPPVFLGEEERIVLEGDVSVVMRMRLMGEKASLLSFNVPNPYGPSSEDEVVTTVIDLLSDLGFTASKENFQHIYVPRRVAG